MYLVLLVVVLVLALKATLQVIQKYSAIHVNLNTIRI